MAGPAIWIDKAVADFSKESVRVKKWSEGEVTVERWSRSDYREYLEDSLRMLDGEDRLDQEQVAHIGKPIKRRKRRKRRKQSEHN